MQDSASFAEGLSLPISDSMKTPEMLKPKQAQALAVVESRKALELEALDIQKRIQGLSYREAEVVGQVIKGHSNKVSAAKLFVTEKTVKFHLTNIYKKAQVKSRSELIVKIASQK